jgi:tetratricopeptide (TPR) repeat protein
LKFYDRGEYDKARDEFLKAQAIFPKPSLLRNLALAELHTGRPLDALKHLRAFLGANQTSPDKKALAQQSLQDAYNQTAHLSITAPPGAHVKVDGTEVGVAPLKEEVDVVVGLHGVDAEAGGATLHEAVQAGAGKLTEVAFVKPVVADTHVVAAPTVAVVPSPIKPDWIQPVPAQEPYWNSRRTVGVVIAGAGAVGMVVGAVFGSMRSGNTSSATQAYATIGSNRTACYSPPASLDSACQSLSGALSNNNDHAYLEGTLLVGGGILLAVGAVTAFFPAASPPTGAGFAPVAGPHGAGFRWAGSF